jgi:membrane-bound serine protease (ClpP class)
LEILLFLLGLILLVVEIFIIPGFGVTGISGITLILVSIFLALLGSDPFLDMKSVSMAIIQLTVSLVAALTGIFLLAKFLPKSTAFSRLVLAETQNADKGFVSFPSDTNLIGKTGIAYTTLRPGGTALIDDKKVDVVADSEYIERDKKIKVIRVEGIKVVVTAVKE